MKQKLFLTLLINFTVLTGLYAVDPEFMSTTNDVHLGIWDGSTVTFWPPGFKKPDYPRFLGEHFDLIIEGTRYPLYLPSYGDSIHKYNPLVTIFRYKSLVAERPAYDNYYADSFPEWTNCNKHEFSFLHSGCPARLTAVPGNNEITLNWTPDARDTIFNRIGAFKGYNVYRGRRPEGPYVKVSSQPFPGNSYLDTEVVNASPYYYYIASVCSLEGSDNDTFAFSLTTDSIKPTPLPSPIILTKGHSQDTIIQDTIIRITFEVTNAGGGTPDTTQVFVDVSKEHNFRDSIVNNDTLFKEIYNLQETRSGVYSGHIDVKLTPLTEVAGYGYFFRFVKGDNVYSLPPDTSKYLYSTDMNNRIRFKQSETGWYFMNPDSSSIWRDMLKERVSYLTSPGDVNGIYHDNVSLWYWFFDCLDYTHRRDRDLWFDIVTDFLAEMKQTITPKLVMYNSLTSKTYEQLSEPVDGVLCETMKPWNKDRFSEWDNRLDAVMAVDTLDKACFIFNRYVYEDSITDRMFCLASYLLAKGNRTYLYYTDSLSKFNYFPEFNIELGSPTETKDSIWQYFDEGDSVYVRDYTNGKSIINFSEADTAHNAYVNFNTTFYNVSPVGKSVFHGGKMKYYPTTQIKLYPATAAVLLKYPYPVDSSNATGMNNQRKVIIGDNGEVFTVYDSKATIRFADMKPGSSNELSPDTTLYYGSFPAIAKRGTNFYEAIWRRQNTILYNSYKVDSAKWLLAKPCTLCTIPEMVGVMSHISSPVIQVSGTMKHFAYGVLTEPSTYPGYITYKLYYKKFQIPGSIQDTAVVDTASEYVSQWTQGLELECASIAMKNDTIPVIAWSRSIGTGKHTIYFKEKGVGGWPSDPETVSVAANTSKHPFCDVANGNIHIVWEEDNKVKYRKKSGANWQSIETVSNTSLTSRSPQMLGGDLCAFTEVPLFPPGNYSHIVYRKRSAFGWGASVVIDSTNSPSEYPQSYIETTPFGRNLHTVWTEGNNLPYEVKYKKVTSP